MDKVPKDWYTYHHANCGTRYRGCDPSLCPKNVYEKTGKWIGTLEDEKNMSKLSEGETNMARKKALPVIKRVRLEGFIRRLDGKIFTVEFIKKDICKNTGNFDS